MENIEQGTNQRDEFICIAQRLDVLMETQASETSNFEQAVMQQFAALQRQLTELARRGIVPQPEEEGIEVETEGPTTEAEQRVREFMEACTVKVDCISWKPNQRRSDTLIRQDAWRAFIQWANENNLSIANIIGRNTFYKTVATLYKLPLVTTNNKYAWAGRQFNLTGKTILDRVSTAIDVKEEEQVWEEEEEEEEEKPRRSRFPHVGEPPKKKVVKGRPSYVFGSAWNEETARLYEQLK